MLSVACSQAIHRVCVLIAYNEDESAATVARSRRHCSVPEFSIDFALPDSVIFEVLLTSTCSLSDPPSRCFDGM